MGSGFGKAGLTDEYSGDCEAGGVTFIYNQDKKIKIFENYGPYICGFSYDGNYFMIVDDAGIIVLKRCCSIPVYRAQKLIR